jgi:hypothetical protein
LNGEEKHLISPSPFKWGGAPSYGAEGSEEGQKMRAEAQAMVKEIEESLELLRRRL